jgi:hypothetical protein
MPGLPLPSRTSPKHQTFPNGNDSMKRKVAAKPKAKLTDAERHGRDRLWGKKAWHKL